MSSNEDKKFSLIFVSLFDPHMRIHSYSLTVLILYTTHPGGYTRGIGAYTLDGVPIQRRTQTRTTGHLECQLA